MSDKRTVATDPLDNHLADYRSTARLGAQLIAHGLVTEGRAIRAISLRNIRRARRNWLRCERQLLQEIGYRDLGEAGA